MANERSALHCSSLVAVSFANTAKKRFLEFSNCNEPSALYAFCNCTSAFTACADIPIENRHRTTTTPTRFKNIYYCV